MGCCLCCNGLSGLSLCLYSGLSLSLYSGLSLSLYNGLRLSLYSGLSGLSSGSNMWTPSLTSGFSLLVGGMELGWYNGRMRMSLEVVCRRRER